MYAESLIIMPPTLPTFPDLRGKIAFITGIGQTPVEGIGDDVWGNGAAIAHLLAHNGVKLFGCDLNLDSAKSTASRIRKLYPECDIELVAADVTKLKDVNTAVDACIILQRRIDILINNVGMTRSGDPVTMSEEVWDKQIDLNLKSVFLTCKAVLPHMEKQGGGVVINNASLTAIRYIGKPQIAYASSKAAVVQFTKHTACMWADRGVRVNAVIPGLIHTPLVEGLWVSDDKADNAAYESIVNAKIPGGRLGDAFDVANAVAFLCSDAARYINGHELVVDGGMSAEAG